MIDDAYYPELVREFYANARKWENQNTEDVLHYKNLGVSSLVNGQQILVDESLLYELFGLSNSGCVVRKEKGVSEFFDEEGTKIAVHL